MAVPAVVDRLEKLDENLRDFYRADDQGRLVLDVAPAEGFELADVAALKKALQQERENARRASRELKSLSEKVGDLDVDAAREALRSQATSAADDEDAPGGAASAPSEPSSELDRLRRDNARLEAQLDQDFLTQRAMQAVAAAGGEADLLLPHLLMQARVVRENDGRRTVRLLDRDGLERLSPADESTAPMSLDERVAELKRDPRFAAAFRASGASGSGAASGPSMPHTTPDTGRMTPVELLRLARRIS